MPGRSEGASGTAGFYATALSRAERMRLPNARDAEGLDEEIVLLRVRLHRVAQEHPEQFDLLLKGVNALVRAVSTKYRLSDKPAEELSKSVIAVLEGIGGALMPEGSTEL